MTSVPTTLPDPQSLQPTTELQNLQAGNVLADTNGTLERRSPGDSGNEVNVIDELMKAAQRNDLETVDRLISSGECTAETTSDDGTTALHWAAINNSMDVATYLLDHGAEIDKKGGELMASPLLWACRMGLSDMVHMLIQRGADPLRSDAQGFNALHISIHSSNVMLIVYLLQQGMSVDYADPQQRTALHWAAYQGDALSVDVLLRWGANVKLRDDTGFTPLHWAVVRGNLQCMKRLIEECSDVEAETSDGKTPAVIAREMMCYPVWLQALKLARRDSTGRLIPARVSRTVMNRIVYIWPFVVMWIVLGLIDQVTALVSLALSILIVYGSHLLLRKVIDFCRLGSIPIHKTPYLAGIFSATAFFVGLRWLLNIFPATFRTSPILNVLFFLFFSYAMMFFFKSMLMDPGFIPKPSGVTEQRQVIEELLDHREYDSRHFCIYCFARRPLRSKHCKSCDRCVAKIDHHCPWINNCVAIRNHRPFLLYVIFMEFGILLFIWLVVKYFQLADTNDEQGTCLVLREELCLIVEYDASMIVLAFWAALQLTWVTALMFVQLYQVCRALTTNEAYNLHRYGWMGGQGDDLPVPSGLADPFAEDKPGAFTHDDHNHSHHHHSAISLCCRLVGITQLLNILSDLCASTNSLSWLSASASGQHSRSRRARISNHMNPFSHGLASNCADFWSSKENVIFEKFADPMAKGGISRMNGATVDYYKLWDLPTIYNQHRHESNEAGNGDEVGELHAMNRQVEELESGFDRRNEPDQLV
ncbi:uncharacterized protein V1516DRAFT_624567 [Lipomyces oligophaga]|uniref:uncharacterized protein n=1 Tax=Lipomyces oligophaga TaxID=45792 RepID=UPI0034CF6AF1